MLRLVIFFNASMAFSDLYSWIKATVTASNTIAMIIVESISSPTKAEIAVAIRSIIIRGSLNCFVNTAALKSLFLL